MAKVATGAAAFAAGLAVSRASVYGGWVPVPVVVMIGGRLPDDREIGLFPRTPAEMAGIAGNLDDPRAYSRRPAWRTRS